MQVGYKLHKRKNSNTIFIVSVLVLLTLVSSVVTTRVLKAADISDALFITGVVVQNDSVARTNFVVPFSASGQSLVDSNQIQSDTLDSIVQLGSTEYPSMPSSSRLNLEGAFADDGGVITEETTGASTAAGLDLTLLPVVPAVDDAYYFGGHHEFTYLILAVGQAGVGTWTLTWEYYDGDSWEALADVTDNTDGYINAGERSVSFARPIDWAEFTLLAKTAFFIRARVSAYTDITTQPIGSQAEYETGQWWTWLPTIGAGEQASFNLYMGGTDKVSNHQIFTGEAGIVTDDASDLEPGNEFSIIYKGRIDYTWSPTGSATHLCIVCKAGAFDLRVSGTNSITARVTGAGGTTALTLSGLTQAVTGETTITVGSDATTLSMTVAGQGIVTGTARDIIDNSNDWLFASSGAVNYTESINLFTESLADSFQYNTEGEWDAGDHSNTDAITGSDPLDITYLDTVWSVGINDGDDGTWDSSTFNNTPSVYYTGNDGGVSKHSFFRFNHVALDQGQTLSTSYLRLNYATGTQSVSGTKVTIFAIDADSASAPGNLGEATGATLTTANVDWNLPYLVDFLTWHSSTDISSIIQEIIDRPGWTRGNSIVLFVKDNSSPTGSFGAWGGLNILSQSVPTYSAQLVATTIDSIITSDILVADGTIGFTEETTSAGWDTDTACNTSQGHVLLNRYGGHEGLITLRTYRSCLGYSLIYPASEGETWSARAMIRQRHAGNDGEAYLGLRWLDVLEAGVATVETNDTGGVYTWLELENNGVVAPADTAFVRLSIRNGCTGSCFQESWIWDEVVLCECASAPDYPDAQNVLPDGGFEGIYAYTNIWESQTLNPTGVSLDSTQVSWTAYEPNKSTLLMETSIDDKATWQTVTNGGSIAGLTVGQDVSSTNIYVRATFSYTGSTVGEDTVDGQFTPILTELTALVAADGTANLEYRLQQLPGLTINDVSAFSHTGVMSYPAQSLAITVTETPGLADFDPSSGDTPVTTGVSGSQAKQVEFSIPGSEGNDGSQFGPGISGLLTTASVALGWDNNTLLSIFILFIALVLGIGGFQASGNPLVVVAAVMLGMGLGVFMGILGPWILITFTIVGGSMVGISKST